jgi:hypothetical protein
MQKIAVHSVPRSGSTWLGEILNSSANVKYCYQPLFSYKFKDFLDKNSSEEEIDNFFSMLNDTDDEFISQKSQRIARKLPHFEKASFATHVIYKEVRYHFILDNLLSQDKSIKLILLVRNPIEVMNSWINAPKEFDKTWDAEKELVFAKRKNAGRKENYFGLDAWVQTTLLFEYLARKYKKRVFLLNYSTLKTRTLQIVESLFKFCDLEFTDSTNSFLRDSSERKISDTYSVFRGREASRILLDDNLIKTITSYINDAGFSHYINAEIDE